MKKLTKTSDPASQKRLSTSKGERSETQLWTIQTKVRLPHKIGQPLGSGGGGDGCA